MARRSGWSRALKARIAVPLLGIYLRGLRSTSRLHVDGETHIDALLQSGRPFIPCFWHQQILVCALYVIGLQSRGLKAGFLISPSRDGEIPARVFSSWGATAIRGSSSRTGAQALRDMYLAVKNDGISPANTPDGPRGPAFEFKHGPLMLSQMTGAPVVPMACAARRALQLKSWDQAMLPGWFNHLSIAIGEPVTIQKGLSMAELEPHRLRLQTELNDLSARARAIWHEKA